MCKPSFMADVSLCVVLEVDLPRLPGFHLSPGAAPPAPGPRSQLVGLQWMDGPAVGLQQLSHPVLLSALEFTPDQHPLHFTLEFSIFYFLSRSSTALPHVPPTPAPNFPSAATNTLLLQQPEPEWVLRLWLHKDTHTG